MFLLRKTISGQANRLAVKGVSKLEGLLSNPPKLLLVHSKGLARMARPCSPRSHMHYYELHKSLNEWLR